MFLTGCGGFKGPAYFAEPGPQGPYFEPGEQSLQPGSDVIDTACKTNRYMDTCLFQKNPVAQEKAAMTTGDLEGARNYGVKIRDLNPTGYLENKFLQVLTLNTPRFTLQQKSLLKAPYNDLRSYMEQLSAYYWANRVFSYVRPRMGPGRLPVQDLKIYADDAFTGYAAATNSIHLEKTSGKVPAAFSSEIVIHLVGQAIAHHLSGKKIFGAERGAKHKTCDLNPHGCCATMEGCSQALTMAFGDYLAGIMNPTQPRLGETVSNDINGQQICGVSRDLNNLSAQQNQSQIYGLCTAAPGRVSLLGAWYASLWWNLRVKADPNDIDMMFFDHAKSWKADTTFLEAKASALELAKKYKGGRYLAAFEAAFAAIANNTVTN